MRGDRIEAAWQRHAIKPGELLAERPGPLPQHHTPCLGQRDHVEVPACDGVLIRTPCQADRLVLHPRNTPSKVKTKRKARGSKTNPPRQEDLLVLREQNTRIKAKAKRGVVPGTESKMPIME